MIKKQIQRALKFICGVVVSDNKGVQKQYEYKVQCHQTPQFGPTITIIDSQDKQFSIPTSFFKSVAQLLHSQKIIELQIQGVQAKQEQQPQPVHVMRGLTSMGGAPLPSLNYSNVTGRGLPQSHIASPVAKQEPTVNVVNTNPPGSSTAASRPSFNPFGSMQSNMIDNIHQAPSLQSLSIMASSAYAQGSQITSFSSSVKKQQPVVIPVSKQIPQNLQKYTVAKSVPSQAEMIASRNSAKQRAEKLKDKMTVKNTGK